MDQGLPPPNPAPPRAARGGLRRIRGHFLAQDPRRRILTTETAAGTVYHVPSETAPGVVYDVFIDDDGQWVYAPCPDWAAWRKPCKHIFEVLERFYPALAPPVPDATPFVKNGWYAGARSYPQEPFSYTEGLAESTRRDRALETQDERVESLLVDLACVVNERHPWTRDAWRPQLPAGDKVLQSVLRDQNRKSLRRFQTILKRLKAEGKIRFAPSRGTVVKYNRSPRTRDYLWESFAGVTEPFRIIDQDLIVDTTGFSPFYISNCATVVPRRTLVARPRTTARGPSGSRSTPSSAGRPRRSWHGR